MFPLSKRFVTFLIVGGTCTLLDLCLLNALLWAFGAWTGPLYALAKAISFCSVASIGYALNRKFTFSDRNGSFRTYFMAAVTSAFIQVSIATAAAWTLAATFPRFKGPITATAGSMFGTGCVVIFNYVALKYFVFRERRPEDEPEGIEEDTVG